MWEVVLIFLHCALVTAYQAWKLLNVLREVGWRWCQTLWAIHLSLRILSYSLLMLSSISSFIAECAFKVILHITLRLIFGVFESLNLLGWHIFLKGFLLRLLLLGSLVFAAGKIRGGRLLFLMKNLSPLLGLGNHINLIWKHLSCIVFLLLRLIVEIVHKGLMMIENIIIIGKV
jgi:hypothetical protein